MTAASVSYEDHNLIQPCCFRSGIMSEYNSFYHGYWRDVSREVQYVIAPKELLFFRCPVVTSGNSLSYTYQVLADIQRTYGSLGDWSPRQEGRPGRITRLGLKLGWGAYSSFS